MSIILGQGGLTRGGLNFDAKVRRGSFDTVDLFHAHIGGMDTFAKGLLIADRLRRDGGPLSPARPALRGLEKGARQALPGRQDVTAGARGLAHQHGEPELASGRQELLENILNGYILNPED